MSIGLLGILGEDVSASLSPATNNAGTVARPAFAAMRRPHAAPGPYRAPREVAGVSPSSPSTEDRNVFGCSGRGQPTAPTTLAKTGLAEPNAIRTA